MRFTRRILARSLWLLVLAPACVRPSSAPVPLTTIREVRALGAAPEGGARPVDLRGTVTYFDRDAGVLYLQDSTAALAFEVGNLGATLVTGQSVVVSGTFDPAASAPRLREPRVTVLGRANPDATLEPRCVPASVLLSHAAEAEWVEVRGLVLSAVPQGSSLMLEVRDQDARFRAHVLGFDPVYLPLVGARVRLRGVASARTYVRPEPADLVVPLLSLMRIEDDPPAPARPTSTTRLTEVAAIRQLTPTDAARAYPVRLRGVVTFNDPELALFFVQDGSGGIYVEAWRHLHQARPGDRVEVEGESAPGAFAPVVERPRVRVLGHGPLPPARPSRVEELITGHQDGQWLELEGLVRAVRFGRRSATIRLASGGVRFSVLLPRVADPQLASRLVNARVRVRGVCRSILTPGNQLADVDLLSPGLDSLVVVTPPPPEPFALAVNPVSSLLHFVPRQQWAHRVRIQGVVTYSRPDEVFVQDATGGVSVHSEGVPPPSVGDLLDVVGFATAGRYKPSLQDSELRARGRGSEPPAATITPEQALTGIYESALVAMEAPLVEIARDADEHHLLMRAGPYPFTAVLPGSLPAGLRPGALLRVSGICTVSPGGAHIPQSLRLLLRGSSDVVVLARGPWWNPRLGIFVLVVLLGVASLAFAWVATLRRRVRAQSAVIWERVRRETELQERQRLARELHDTLEQNLTGIGLCVEAAGRALPETGKAAARHLDLAVQQVGAAIDEVRRSVWALREHPLEAGLAAALEEVGEQLAACSSTPIEIRTQVDGTPRPLAVTIENDLLRIGQEALTNAVRHGKAAHIGVDLRYDPQAFRLRVSDDGCGFDTSQPIHAGHFGLVGMRERAQAMGARIDVESVVGRGTTLTITLAEAGA